MSDLTAKLQGLATEVAALEAENQTLRAKLDEANNPGVVYVRLGAANTNTGRSQDSPIGSIEKAKTLLRDGKGDSLLLHRGSVFDEGFGEWTKSGESPEKPMTIGAWGEVPGALNPFVPGYRSRLAVSGSALIVPVGATVRNLKLEGLHLSPSDTPSANNRYGVWVRGAVEGLTLDVCRIERFTNNVAIDSTETTPSRDVLVRLCQLLDAVPGNGQYFGQGIYAQHTHGLFLFASALDHNGWVAGGKRNAFRHNAYIQDNCRDAKAATCLFAEGGSHGLQLRCGGRVEECLFIDNATHLVVSGESADATGNVLLGGAGLDIPNDPRGFGMVLEAGANNAADNIVALKPATNPNNGAAFFVNRGDHWAGPIAASLSRNLVSGWHGNGVQNNADNVTLLEMKGNEIGVVGTGRPAVRLSKPVAQFSGEGNRYAADGEPGKWFIYADGTKSGVGGWEAKMGDVGAVAGVNTYAASGVTPEERQGMRDGSLAPSHVLRRVRAVFGR